MMDAGFDREIAEMHARALRESAEQQRLVSCAKQVRRRRTRAAAAAAAAVPRAGCPKDVG